MSDAVERAVERVRLSGPGAGAGAGGPGRSRFSLARAQALAALRSRSRSAWAFSLDLLRAARMFDDSARATVTAWLADDGRHLTFDFDVDGFAPGRIVTSGFLEAALVPFSSTAPPDERWRWAMARAINGAVGQGPESVRVRTPGFAWTYARVAESSGEPYRAFERGEPRPGGFTVEIVSAPPSVGRSLRSLLGLDRPSLQAIAEEWSRALGATIRVSDLEAGAELELPPAVREFELGEVGRFRLLEENAGDAHELFLTHAGVRVCGLGPLLQKHGVSAEALVGQVESGRVSLDIDERAVVDDERAARLVAWLAEIAQLPDARSDPFPPPDPTRLPTVGGDVVDREALGRGRWTYVWRHQSQGVATANDAGALALWPSQLHSLEQAGLASALTPHWVLRAAAGSELFDPTALLQGCFAPLHVEVPQQIAGVHIDLRVLVHRYAAASGGSARVIAWGREVARFGAEAVAIPGITLLVELSASAGGNEALADLAQTSVRLGEVVRELCSSVWAQIDAADALAWAETGGGGVASLRVPLLAWRAERLWGAVVALRYEVGPSGALRLAWSDATLLGITVGTTRSGEPRTLRDALERLVSVGGIVLGESGERWVTLESEVPALQPWVLTKLGRGSLTRLVGPRALWEMPVAPAALPAPMPAAEQQHLLLSASRVTELAKRRATDGRANESLLGHLLVARILGQSDHGAAALPLVHTFDPHALSGRRRRPLDAVIEAGVDLVAPFGAVGRGQEETMIEASPGVACLLQELGLVRPAAPPPSRLSAPVLADRAAVGRRQPSTRVDPDVILVRERVVDRLCVGAVFVARSPEPEIELWAKGLRVGAFRLPRPLRGVAGRLWLTEAGINAGHTGIVKVCLDAAGRLRERARSTLRLSLAGTPRASTLRAFVGDEPDESASPRRASVQPLRALGPSAERLGAIVRHALARPVHIDTAWLSWTVAKVVNAEFPGSIELGKRNALVRDALDEGTAVIEVCAAAVVIIAEVLAAAPEFGEIGTSLARVLATARYAAAHQPR